MKLPRHHRGIAVIATATALAITTAVTATTAATATATATARTTTHSSEPSLVGTGKIYYRYSPHDDIRFHFDAHGWYTLTNGTFSLSHRIRLANGSYFTAHQTGSVDCLATGGHMAILTAKITRSNVGHVGEEVGFSVEDNGRDSRLGFSWGIVNSAGMPRCFATAPFNPVTAGRFVVRDVPLPANPPWIPPTKPTT